jgi:pilus assembly protein CpaE
MSDPALDLDLDAEDARDVAPSRAQDPAAPPSEIRHVPRIAIQAFCETQETANAIQNAMVDRRLARAHVAVQTGGIATAIDYYSNAPTPNLVIVETSAEGKRILAELERLAAVCDSGTKVIVIGHVNDVVLYRDLVRQGVSDYLVTPLSVLQIIDAIATIYENPQTGPVGRTVAFIGAKGGVGSSTVAHNIAWSISEILEEDVVIADLDLAFGTVGLDFNQDPPQGIADALNSPDRLDEVLLDRLLSKCTDRLNLFAAPSTLDREYDIEPNGLDQITDILRGSVPCVVLDVPHVWTGWVKRTLLAADEIVVTATPDLANLRNAKNLIDLLRNQRPNDSPPLLVLNQVGMAKRPEIGVKDFADALSLEPVLTINFDPQLFGTAANNGQMIAELQSGAKLADAFTNLAKRITGRAEVKTQRKSRLGALKLSFRRKKG